MMHVLGGAVVIAQRKSDIITKPLKNKIKNMQPSCTGGSRLDNALLRSKRDRTALVCHKYL